MAYELPPESAVVRLGRFCNDDLILCEAVEFAGGSAAIDTVLRRAANSGRVEVEGEIEDHLADLLDRKGDLLATVALDRDSYRALKTRWMRCRVERNDAP